MSEKDRSTLKGWGLGAMGAAVGGLILLATQVLLGAPTPVSRLREDVVVLREADEIHDERIEKLERMPDWIRDEFAGVRSDMAAIRSSREKDQAQILGVLEKILSAARQPR